VVVIFTGLLLGVMATVYLERKVIAVMQVRVGPNRAGPFGALQTLADGVKLMFKEGITPVTADLSVYLLAPVASLAPALLAVAVVMATGPGARSGIVAAQELHFDVPGLRWIPKWNLFVQFPAFVFYGIAARAENNRPPFDLTEAETELVAGYQTEYSGMRFAFFYLAEYMHLVTLSAVATTLLLGGWRGPVWSFLA